MHSLIKRLLAADIQSDIGYYPAVAILGPRQCGKSTLAKMLLSDIEKTLYVDLEKPSDLSKLDDPEIFFKKNSKKLICLDEIQRKPELFPVLRSVLDENNRNGQIIILGSASRDLIKQSSESLAGRISYRELTPFLLGELAPEYNNEILYDLWLKGGFPGSYLLKNNDKSLGWRQNFISTFLERDIPMLGFNIPAQTMRRLWSMCAHLHGDMLNSSKLGESLGLSHTTIRTYIDLLEQTFMLRVLYPYETNSKKRLKKSPKIYIRDSGILHALLGIETINDLLGHPVFGSSWEGFVLENILSELPSWKASFFRTANGSEIDLILEKGIKRIAVECKASTAPNISKGFYNCLEDLGLKEAWIIAPVEEAYPVKDKVMVTPLNMFIKEMKG